MPSYYESFGLATLEAMACGTAVVASRVGGPRSFVEDGRTGFLVPWACPEPYTERLEMLLSDPALQARIGSGGAAKARAMGWNTVVSPLLDHYDALIGETWMNVAGA
jgi:glycosyltransferase involved in cell wall biosynthesis